MLNKLFLICGGIHVVLDKFIKLNIVEDCVNELQETMISAEAAIAKAREYLKTMLGHPYFEIEATTEKKDGYWVIDLDLVHMIRTARSKYTIKVNAKTGEVESAERENGHRD